MNGTMAVLSTQSAVLVDSVGWYLEAVQFGEASVPHTISLYVTSEFSLYEDRDIRPSYFLHHLLRPPYNQMWLETKTYILPGVAVVMESTTCIDFFYIRREDT